MYVSWRFPRKYNPVGDYRQGCWNLDCSTSCDADAQPVERGRRAKSAGTAHHMSAEISDTERAYMDDRRDSTGIAGLDDVLVGGFPRGHLFLVEGEPGTGKTTMALQFLLAGAAVGEKGMYITLSESKRELLEVARSHRWSLQDISLFEYTPTEECPARRRSILGISSVGTRIPGRYQKYP